MFGITDVSIIAVVIATVVNMGLAWGWYSPQVFGRQWVEAHGWDMSTLRADVKQYVSAFVVSLVTAWVLAALLNHFSVVKTGEAICFAFWIWLGFIATSHFSGVIWANKPLKAYFIDVGYGLVSLIVMALILNIL